MPIQAEKKKCGPPGIIGHARGLQSCASGWDLPQLVLLIGLTLPLYRWLPDPKLLSSYLPELQLKQRTIFAQLSSSFPPEACCSFCVSYSYWSHPILLFRDIWDLRDSFEGFSSLKYQQQQEWQQWQQPSLVPWWGSAVCTHSIGGPTHMTL